MKIKKNDSWGCVIGRVESFWDIIFRIENWKVNFFIEGKISTHHFFNIFINFNEGHVRLKKELNFNRVQSWKKKRSSTGTFPKWHFPKLTLRYAGTFSNCHFPNWHFLQFFEPFPIWVLQLPVPRMKTLRYLYPL